MPSKSPSQARMMAAAAHSQNFAKQVGVPQSVAQDEEQADQQHHQGDPDGDRRIFRA